MGDGRLPLPTAKGTHGELRALATSHDEERRGLTDSEIASSSACRKRFEVLFCLRACWPLRGVGEERVAAPAPKLLPPLRRWP